jgi:hypothetical protein
MKKLILLVVFTFTVTITNLYACSCGYHGPFLQVAIETPLVGLFKVTKLLTFKNISGKPTPMSMEVEMIEKYKGEDNRKRIVVWGDPGHLCRPYLSLFTEAQYYVIALNSVGKRMPEEKETDYFISICGAYWLNVNFKKSTVTGDIDSNNETSKTISLNELKAELRATKD